MMTEESTIKKIPVPRPQFKACWKNKAIHLISSLRALRFLKIYFGLSHRRASEDTWKIPHVSSFSRSVLLYRRTRNKIWQLHTSRETCTSWWRNSVSEMGLSPRFWSPKLLSDMTYLLARLLSEYSRVLALVSDWIKLFGNTSSASTKICQNRHLYPRLQQQLTPNRSPSWWASAPNNSVNLPLTRSKFAFPSVLFLLPLPSI